jgi:hypothetical protein
LEEVEHKGRGTQRRAARQSEHLTVVQEAVEISAGTFLLVALNDEVRGVRSPLAVAETKSSDDGHDGGIVARVQQERSDRGTTDNLLQSGVHLVEQEANVEGHNVAVVVLGKVVVSQIVLKAVIEVHSNTLGQRQAVADVSRQAIEQICHHTCQNYTTINSSASSTYLPS